MVAAQGESFDLVLGPRNYDLWSGYWPKQPSNRMSDGLNGATKYVASHRPEALNGARSSSLSRTSSGILAVSSRTTALT